MSTKKSMEALQKHMFWDQVSSDLLLKDQVNLQWIKGNLYCAELKEKGLTKDFSIIRKPSLDEGVHKRDSKFSTTCYLNLLVETLRSLQPKQHQSLFSEASRVGQRWDPTSLRIG
jgi:hypothetical protein